MMTEICGILLGWLGHSFRADLEELVPQRRGWFPLSCYLTGGLLVIAISALTFGWKHALKVLHSFAVVGTGVGLAWLLDR